MTNVISELKKEHAEIKDTLRKIDRIGQYNKETRVELMLVRDFFLKHLEKEEEVLFPEYEKLLPL